MTLDKKKCELLLSVGMIILFVSALLPLLQIHYAAERYVYAFGAALTLIARIFDRCKEKNTTLARLYRIQIVSALCYCVSAGLLFYASGEKDWIAFLLAGAVLQIYTSFRIQSEQGKGAK